MLLSKKMFSFKINKLSTTDNILNGKSCDVLYTGYLNKDISFGDIVYFEATNVQYKKLVNGVIDQLKVSLVDGDGNEILSNFNPIRPGGGSEARMTKLTAANQKPLTL